jgi:hypothetical protein
MAREMIKHQKNKYRECDITFENGINCGTSPYLQPTVLPLLPVGKTVEKEKLLNLGLFRTTSGPSKSPTA